MNKKGLVLILTIFCVSISAYAYEASKPDSHNTAWLDLHGKQAAISDADCIACHTERLNCIACHEDVPPRSHNGSWVNKTHGMQARWDSQGCKTCHTEDSCSSCHDRAVPVNHNRAGFGKEGNAGFHCLTSCQLPSGMWKNTLSQNCVVCHQTRPIKSNGQAHEMMQ